MLEGRYHKYMDINGSTAQRQIRLNAFITALLFYLVGWISSYAYTPPFYNKCKFFISNYRFCFYENTCAWHNAYYSAFGNRTSDIACPGCMVDHNGDLFFVALDPDMDISDYRCCLDCYKYTKDGTSYANRKFLRPAELLDKDSWADEPTSSLSDYYKQFIWMAATPSIAYESVASDYVYVVFYVMPIRFWQSGGSIEGFLFIKIKKSDLSVVSNKLKDYGPNLGFDGFPTLGKETNRLGYISYCNSNIASVYYFNKYSGYTRGTLSLKGEVCLADLSSFNGVKNYSSESNNLMTFERILTHEGSTYMLIMRNGYYQYVYSIDNDGIVGYVGHSVWGNNLHSSSWNTDVCNYHSDLGLVTAKDGTKIFLLMMLSYGNRCSSMQSENKGTSTWSTNKAPCGMNNVVLHIESSTSGGNWTGGPENVIYTTNISCCNASTSDTCSEATLYKNTHKFVVYKDYIIYAYCYPGKSKQLILGAARYYIDSQHQFHLLTKTEFRDKDGNSFGTLTNCDRLVFMDIKDGHLWLVWKSSDLCFRMMYVNAQDVIDASI